MALAATGKLTAASRQWEVDRRKEEIDTECAKSEVKRPMN
jgi:hypothetical protein